MRENVSLNNCCIITPGWKYAIAEDFKGNRKRLQNRLQSLDLL